MKRLRFTVNHPPVSTNDQYGRGALIKGKRGFYNKKPAADFKKAVHDAAFCAVLKTGLPGMKRMWPKPEDVEQVYVEIVVFNTRHDCSAAEKLVCDGMEGIVYKNDRVAHPRFNDIAKDSGPPRVEIMVELTKERK